MGNQKISANQMKYVIALFITASSLVGAKFGKAKQDTWIAMILSIAFIAPLIFIYNGILRLYPGKNLFDILIEVFGKILGKIICIMYILYSIHLASLILNVYVEFIHINMLTTPKIVISSIMIIVCIFLIYCGIHNIGRISKFMFPFLIVSLLITVLAAIKDMDFNNLKPVMNSKFNDILSSSYSVFTKPLGELILFLPLFSSVDTKENYNKMFFKGILLGILVLVVANIRNTLILSPVSLKMFPFASYKAVSVIAIGDFFTRIEVFIGINLVLAGFIKTCVCYFSSTIGLSRVLNITDYKYMAIPCALIILTLTSFLYKNTEEMFEWYKVYQIYAIPFEIILPIIILLTAFIKKIAKPNINNENLPNPNQI